MILRKVCVRAHVHTACLCAHTGGEVPSLPNSFFKENGVDFNFFSYMNGYSDCMDVCVQLVACGHRMRVSGLLEWSYSCRRWL